MEFEIRGGHIAFKGDLEEIKAELKTKRCPGCLNICEKPDDAGSILGQEYVKVCSMALITDRVNFLKQANCLKEIQN